MSPESSVEVLKNVVLPAGSDDTSARMFARMIKHGTGAPEALYRGVRLSRGAGGPKAREAVAYWKDRVGRSPDDCPASAARASGWYSPCAGT